MNAPQITIRPRTLSNLLEDIRHARRDYDDAMASSRFRAADQANEAETRLEDVRQEFDALLAETTGMTIEDFRKAYAEALI